MCAVKSQLRLCLFSGPCKLYSVCAQSLPFPTKTILVSIFGTAQHAWSESLTQASLRQSTPSGMDGSQDGSSRCITHNALQHGHHRGLLSTTSTTSSTTMRRSPSTTLLSTLLLVATVTGHAPSSASTMRSTTLLSTMLLLAGHGDAANTFSSALGTQVCGTASDLALTASDLRDDLAAPATPVTCSGKFPKCCKADGGGDSFTCIGPDETCCGGSACENQATYCCPVAAGASCAGGKCPARCCPQWTICCTKGGRDGCCNPLEVQLQQALGGSGGAVKAAERAAVADDDADMPDASAVYALFLEAGTVHTTLKSGAHHRRRHRRDHVNQAGRELRLHGHDADVRVQSQHQRVCHVRERLCQARSTRCQHGDDRGADWRDEDRNARSCGLPDWLRGTTRRASRWLSRPARLPASRRARAILPTASASTASQPAAIRSC